MSITRAPWKVGRALSNGQECIVGDGDSVVALMPDANTGCTFKPDDARLIASAPDLLEALKAMRTVMDMGSKPSKLDEALSWRACDEKARSMCDAAIAAATGDKA